jgi:hypothetical protein
MTAVEMDFSTMKSVLKIHLSNTNVPVPAQRWQRWHTQYNGHAIVLKKTMQIICTDHDQIEGSVQQISTKFSLLGSILQSTNNESENISVATNDVTIRFTP